MIQETEIVGTLIRNGGGQEMLIPESELQQIDALANTCRHCGKGFEPRKGSGGRPQRFCSPQCRTAWHADGQRGQRSPTCSEPNAKALPIEPPKEKSLVLSQNEITIEHDDQTGEWVIRQKNWPDDDAQIYINDEAVHDFVDRLTDYLGYGSARP
jgi:hypothetical protein